MKKTDIALMALGNFRRRKARSVLTVLGVVIGVASIVVMISLGVALNVNFSKEMENMGDLTLVNVYPNWSEGKEVPLTDDAVKELQTIDGVIAVSPQVSLYGHFISGKYHANVSIIGVRRDIMEKLGFTVASGEMLPETSTAAGKTFSCLFGSQVASFFYNPRDNGSWGGGGIAYKEAIAPGGVVVDDGEYQEPVLLVDPLTDRIQFTFDYNYKMPNTYDDGNTNVAKVYTLDITGVLASENGEKDYNVYVDMETALKLKKEYDKYNGNKTSAKITYDQIYVKAKTMNETIDIAKQIQDLGYQAYANAEWIASYQKQMQSIQLILGGIGAVSLLVAAIGITNTMIMSIYERTREIGIMKVIGCVVGDIRSLFLYEAGIIGLVGGAIGIGFSYALSFVLNKVGGGSLFGGMDGSKLSVIPAWLALGAVLFAVLVGLIAGFLPAHRATRLSALEAMRY
ncbi:MAG TPA: ABC transporter permease [Oscillospiraceae bacterium]|nr:ABC transporter permease [Oscillospiraceae bacterium]HPF55536.1 ABC transporter permease [Clostridiales bacterium]HPK35319.1 ABC transporter permease [Oscillospiraceae bacterium]HPR76255.1 ABC transporter permease [Oscillospiraceae bacterium]